MRRMAWLAVFLLVPVLAVAEMPPDENIKAVAESWLARTGLAPVPAEVTVTFE